MKKQIVIAVSSLILSSSLNAFSPVSGEYCFRPAFKTKLKHVNSIKRGSFRSLSLKKKVSKKEVFINWRKLYWGKLSDLIYSEEETYADASHEIVGFEEENISSLDTENALAFAKELRQELKTFARQYNLKIVWRKKSLDITDGTEAFLEYWDKGHSQENRENIPLFEKISPLSIRDTSSKERAAKVTPIKHRNTQARIKDISYATLFLKKGA